MVMIHNLPPVTGLSFCLPADNSALNFHFRFCFLETRLLPIPSVWVPWETDSKTWMHRCIYSCSQDSINSQHDGEEEEVICDAVAPETSGNSMGSPSGMSLTQALTSYYLQAMLLLWKAKGHKVAHITMCTDYPGQL